MTHVYFYPHCNIFKIVHFIFHCIEHVSDYVYVCAHIYIYIRNLCHDNINSKTPMHSIPNLGFRISTLALKSLVCPYINISLI
jgi:hypothetical protein